MMSSHNDKRYRTDWSKVHILNKTNFINQSWMYPVIQLREVQLTRKIDEVNKSDIEIRSQTPNRGISSKDLPCTDNARESQSREDIDLI